MDAPTRYRRCHTRYDQERVCRASRTAAAESFAGEGERILRPTMTDLPQTFAGKMALPAL